VIVLLDANVLVSMALAPISGAIAQVLLAWAQRRFDVAVSDFILHEFQRTLRSSWFRQRASEEDVRTFTAFVLRHAVVYPATTTVTGVATHPEDDLVLAAAVSAGATYLVTGDRRFRERVPSYRGVQLVSPAEFVAILESRAGPG